jgi:hypothetical protein
MDNLSAAWLYPIIIIAGLPQAWGPPMNNALKKALVNPWLGSLVSFLPIVAFLSVVLMCLPMRRTFSHRLTACVTLCLGLGACGGGGGGNPMPQTYTIGGAVSGLSLIH